MRIALFTAATCSHIHLAETMLASAARWIPDASQHLIVTDLAPGESCPVAPHIELISAIELGLPRFPDLAFVNDATGLCCLMKPAGARHLLARPGVDAVIYADSDTLWFAEPTTLRSFLAQSPVALTPHALAPLPATAARRDGDIVRSGAFNAGFFAVRQSDEGHTFLRWWLDSLLAERCLEPEVAYDQRWLDLAPVYFPFVGVFRDPGYNVAYWNYRQRELTLAPDSTLRVQDGPLVLFHFSYFDFRRADHLAIRPPIAVRADSPALHTLLERYLAALAAAPRSNPAPYRFGHFTDGQPITSEHRRFFLARVWHNPDRTGSPFSPEFRTRDYHGLRSVYARETPQARAMRALWRIARRAFGRSLN